jgi:hypothetical protein
MRTRYRDHRCLGWRPRRVACSRGSRSPRAGARAGRRSSRRQRGGAGGLLVAAPAPAGAHSGAIQTIDGTEMGVGTGGAPPAITTVAPRAITTAAITGPRTTVTAKKASQKACSPSPPGHQPQGNQLQAVGAYRGWLDTKRAAAYLGLSVNALHKLTAECAIPFQQEGQGCKAWFKRTELGSWREAGGSRAANCA